MFDIAPTEFLLIAVVALVVIGPKDLPKAMRFAGYWVGRARGVARQFRSGFDAMVREAELAEMEKKWAEENARIMREHPAAALPAERIMGVETGGCPHTAIREDASINLEAVSRMQKRFPDLDVIFIESGGDNLAATFSPELSDLTLYVIDVAGGAVLA